MRRLTGSVRLGLPLAALFVAVLSCPTRAASAGGSLSNTSGRGPRIVVLAVALDPKIRPQVGLLEHAAEEALTHSARFDLLLGVDAYDPGAQAARGAAALKAASRVKEGRKAIDDLDTTAATAAFVDAVSQYKATNSALTFGSLIDAWVMKAASLASGDAGPAKQDIDRIIALSARAEFSNQYFPPELLKYADTQKKMAANAKGELIVRTEPPGAAVWVDGQYRGVSPAQVSNIMGGRHLVAAALNGYALGQEEFTPGEGLLSLKPAELQSAVFKAQDAVSKDPEGLTREQAAMTLAKRAGADQVLVLVAKKSLAGEQMELTVVRVDATDGHNWGYQTAVVPLNNEATLSGVIDLVVATDTARLEGRKPVFHLKNSGGSTGKKVAGGILLAAGAGLVGAGVYTGLQAQASVAEYHGIKQVQTDIAQSVASRGRAFSIMADASFVLAAASFVTGTVLLATSGPPKTSEVDEPRPSERSGPSGSTRDEAPPPSKSNTGWGAPAKRESSD